jgi:hypothetical protein
MSDGLRRLRLFQVGWWTLLSWGGGEFESLLMQLLLIFTTHDALIEDGRVRAELAAVVRLAFSIFRKLKLRQYWRGRRQVDELDEQLSELYHRGATLFRVEADDSEESSHMASATKLPYGRMAMTMMMMQTMRMLIWLKISKHRGPLVNWIPEGRC